MKKIIIFTILFTCILVGLYSQTYPKFVVSDLIVKKINIGLEQRYKGIGLEVIADFSKPEFLGRKFFDNDSKPRFAYGIGARYYFDPHKIKKNQHYLSIVAKNTTQKREFEESTYKKTSRSLGVVYGWRKGLYQKLYYEINIGLINHYKFQYFDAERDYEIFVTPNFLPTPTFTDLNNPFAGLGNVGQNKKYSYVQLLFNFSLTYQL